MNAPLPIPDDLRIEEPNPYRRRQKVIGIRRGAGRAARIARMYAIGLFVTLALAAFGDWACRRVIASGLFLFQPRRDVALAGNHVVSPEDVLNALGFGDDIKSPAVSLFHINLARAQRHVDSIPWVESSRIERVFPDRLRITIVERKPVAYAEVNGGIDLVDQDGVFLQPPRKDPLDFPVLYGLDEAASAGDRKAMIARYERFMWDIGDVMRGSSWSVSEVDSSAPDDLRALLVSEKTTILAHFGSGDYAARFKTFTEVAPQALASNPRIDSIDLRYPGEVVVDPAEPASSAPQNQKAAAPPAKKTLARRGARRKRRRPA